MPTSTYVALATTSFATTTTSVTFSSMPSYRDYVVVLNGVAAGSGGYSHVGFRLNGDSGSNYYNLMMRGTSAGTQSATATRTDFRTTWSAFESGYEGVVIAEFMDGGASDKHKTLLAKADYGRDSDGSLATERYASRWANTAAITSIEVIMDNDGFSSGTISLYGIEA